MSDEAANKLTAQEIQLVQLQANYKKLSDDYNKYRQRVFKDICCQHEQIQRYKKDRTTLQTLVEASKSARSKKRAAAMTNDMTDLMNAIKAADQDIIDETESITKHRYKMRAWEAKVESQRTKLCELCVFNNRVTKQRQIRRLERKHEQLTVQFNTLLTSNRQLHQEINHLRIERKTFNEYYGKFKRALENAKKKKLNILTSSSLALDYRLEMLGKIQTLKENDERDQRTVDQNVKDGMRKFHYEESLSSFVHAKLNTRQDYKELEAAKAHIETEKNLEVDTMTLEQNMEAFKSMQEVTDQVEIDAMVNNFMMKDSENFALFNYVTSLNVEIEVLQEELTKTEKEVDGLLYAENSETSDHAHTMAQLEEEYQAMHQVVTKSEQEFEGVQSKFAKLQETIMSTFKSIDCDERILEEMLGLDTILGTHNMILFLGQIEYRAVELLNILHYMIRKKAEMGGLPPDVMVRPDIGAFSTKRSSDVDFVSLPTPLDRDVDPGETDVILEHGPLDDDDLKSFAKANINHRIQVHQRLKASDGAAPAKAKKEG